MSFYGNVANLPQFTIDKVFPNRATMIDGVATDDVFVGRYVQINYGSGNENFLIDSERGCLIEGRSAHLSVWQKAWENNELTYRLIAEFQSNAEKPVLELLPLAPNVEVGQSKLNTQMSYNGKENGYTLRWQDPYQIQFDGVYDEDTGTSKDFANIAGFNLFKRNVVEGADIFKAEKVSSGTSYYVPGANAGEFKLEENVPDILKYTVNLPSIGNRIAFINDLLIGQDRNLLKPESYLNEVIDDYDYLIEGKNPDDYYPYIYYDSDFIEFFCLTRSPIYNTENGQIIGHKYKKETYINLGLNAAVIGADDKYQVNGLFHLLKVFYERYRMIEESGTDAFMTKSQLENMVHPFSSRWKADDIEGPIVVIDRTSDSGFFETTYSHIDAPATGFSQHQITLVNEIKKNQTIVPALVRFKTNFIAGETIDLLPPKDSSEATQTKLKNMKQVQLYMMNGQIAVSGAFAADTIAILYFDLEARKVYINSAVPTWIWPSGS